MKSLPVKSMLITLAVVGYISPTFLCAAELKSAPSPEDTSVENVSRVHIRSLAASCVVCHGSGGHTGDVGKISGLAGMDAQSFITAIQLYKDGKRSATVMHHHAKGLTTPEIRALAVYFSKQTPNQPSGLPHQTLAESHAN